MSIHSLLVIISIKVAASSHHFFVWKKQGKDNFARTTTILSNVSIQRLYCSEKKCLFLLFFLGAQLTPDILHYTEVFWLE